MLRLPTVQRRSSSIPHHPSPGLLVALLMSTVFMMGITLNGLIGPNRSSIEAEYHLNHATFGLGVAVMQIVAAVFMLWITPRIRQMNGFYVLIAAHCCQVLGYCSIVFIPHVTGILIGWAGVMLGHVALALVNNLILQFSAENPRRGIVLLHACNSLGKVAGPLIAAVCLLWQWRINFLIVGSMTLLLAVLYATNTHHMTSNVQDGPEPPHDDHRSLRDAFFWFSVMPFGLIAGGEIAFATLMPQYMEKTRHYSPTAASLLLTLHLCGLVAGRFLTVFFGDRLSNNRIIGICLLAGIAGIPVVFVAHPMILYPSLFLLGLMFSSTWPTYYAQGARINAHRLTLFAYGTALTNTTGVAVCTLISSFIADVNYPAALLFGPAVLWLFGVLYYGSRLSHPHPVAPVQEPVAE